MPSYSKRRYLGKAREGGPGPDEWVLIRGEADPDQFPIGLGLARTWLHRIGPTAGWLLMELNTRAWAGPEPELLDAEVVSRALGVSRTVMWNAAHRLQQFGLVAINDDGAVVVHATRPGPLANHRAGAHRG